MASKHTKTSAGTRDSSKSAGGVKKKARLEASQATENKVVNGVSVDTESKVVEIATPADTRSRKSRDNGDGDDEKAIEDAAHEIKEDDVDHDSASPRNDLPVASQFVTRKCEAHRDIRMKRVQIRECGQCRLAIRIGRGDETAVSPPSWWAVIWPAGVRVRSHGDMEAATTGLLPARKVVKANMRVGDWIQHDDGWSLTRGRTGTSVIKQQFMRTLQPEDLLVQSTQSL